MPVDVLKTPTDEILERICDVSYNLHAQPGTDGNIKITDVHQHNACNHTFSGTITIENIEYGFVIENGDWAGTVVKEWGLAEDIGTYTPPEPGEQLTFIPNNMHLKTENPALFKVYLNWRKQSWFKEMIGKYLYDRHFQPGSFIENHYKEWAAKKGMVIGLLSDVK